MTAILVILFNADIFISASFFMLLYFFSNGFWHFFCFQVSLVLLALDIRHAIQGSGWCYLPPEDYFCFWWDWPTLIKSVSEQIQNQALVFMKVDAFIVHPYFWVITLLEVLTKNRVNIMLPFLWLALNSTFVSSTRLKLPEVTLSFSLSALSVQLLSILGNVCQLANALEEKQHRMSGSLFLLPFFLRS